MFCWDDAGWFESESMAQRDLYSGEFDLPPQSTDIAPAEEMDPECFYRWDEEKTQWLAIPKPKTAAECVGTVVSHESQTPHDIELRAIFESLTKDSQEYRLGRGEDLSWYVEAIPPPTEAELESEAANAELSAFDAQIQDLKDRMSLAMLQGDQEQVEALRIEYQQLMEA